MLAICQSMTCHAASVMYRVQERFMATGAQGVQAKALALYYRREEKYITAFTKQPDRTTNKYKIRNPAGGACYYNFKKGVYNPVDADKNGKGWVPNDLNHYISHVLLWC